VAANWYNLGAALYRAGDATGARAVWVHAARLAPREIVIEDALQRVPPTDPVTRDLVTIQPFTPWEALIGAVGLWLAGWLLVAVRRGRRTAVLAIVGALVVGAWAVRTEQAYRRPIALVRRANTPLRSAPYASVVRRTHGAWLLVERGGQAGWLLASEVVRL